MTRPVARRGGGRTDFRPGAHRRLRAEPGAQTALRAGLPVDTPAVTVNLVCGSGLKAVQQAVQAIRCGDAEIVIAGGQESMSNAPYLMNGARDGLRFGHASLRGHA